MVAKSKSKSIIFIIPLLIFLGVVLFLFLRVNKPAQITINTATNQPLPAFELANLEDEKLTINNGDLPNEAYLLNFWGSWCIACSREHPLLMSLKKDGIKIVGVNYKDAPEFAKQYLQDEGNPYLLNIKDEEGDLGMDLGLTGAPETFVVDDKGVIKQHIVGEITSEKWQTSIAPCLTAVQKRDENQIAQLCQ